MEIKKSTTLCFSGHRADRLPQTPQGQTRLIQALDQAIAGAVAAGMDTFLTGACHGFDLLAAQQVHGLRLHHPQAAAPIRLIAVVPFQGQAQGWDTAQRTLYAHILDCCDQVIVLNQQYQRGCYFQRNRWMVDHAGFMLCYYDGGRGGTGYTVQYAHRAGMPITNLYQP